LIFYSNMTQRNCKEGIDKPMQLGLR
jgi:hypothetical protein